MSRKDKVSMDLKMYLFSIEHHSEILKTEEFDICTLVILVKTTFYSQWPTS